MTTGMRAVFGSVRGRVAAGVLTFWLGAVGIVVMSPTSRRPSAIVANWIDVLQFFDAPMWLTRFSLWQALLNAVLFLPAGLLGPVLVPMRGWKRWLVLGLTAGVLVELVQEFALPHRQASIQDAVMNGAGVLLGYLIFAVVARWRRRPGRHKL